MMIYRRILVVGALFSSIAAFTGCTDAVEPVLSPSDLYAAPHPPLPQVIDRGGPVNAQPVFTAITYPGDSYVNSLETFLSNVGASSYWSAATSEYGVGPAQAGTPVHLTEQAPDSIDDNGIQAWLTSKLDGTHPEFGTPNKNSIYVIYYPVSTTVTQSAGQGCVAFGGYHSQITLPNGTSVSYAVIVRCSNSDLNLLTRVTSHEIVEASTDPAPFNNAAYSNVGPAYAIWNTVSSGSEVGDLCQIYPDSNYTPPDLGFMVQRTWSNALAAAGANPCAPNLPNEIYFNASPVLSDVVVYEDTTPFPNTTVGVEIPVGQSKTIQLDLYSNGPTAPWKLSTQELGTKVSNLDLSFDKSSGVNGDKVQLTITVKSQNPKYSAEVFWIVSTLNGLSHYWPVVVGN